MDRSRSAIRGVASTGRCAMAALQHLTGVALAIGSIACAIAPQPSAVTASTTRAISVDAVAVPLNPRNPSQQSLGDFVYAGGLVLTSRETDLLHGLSDLEVTDTNKITAVTDIGVLLDARLMFDEAGRLVNVSDARLTVLTGLDGKPLSGKTDADAEGFAQLPNGDRLVSFERRDRIWLYPAAGGPPRPVPAPQVPFPPNAGMEALAADPTVAPDAYVVGAEASGATWTCRVSAPCIEGPSVAKPEDFGLVALKRLPAMQTAYLLRAFDDVRGSRSSLQIFRANTMVGHLEMAAPLTVDNFEGLAAVPRPDGSVRFYLASDDNDSASQRTLLLAFDWLPRESRS